MFNYNYHPGTGEFTGTTLADESPREPGVFLLPAHATRVAPPIPSDGHVMVFAGGQWGEVLDCRGQTWWDDTGKPVTIGFLGDPIERGLSPSAPEPEPDPEPEPIEQPPLPVRVNIERDRRITEGKAIAVTGYGEIPLSGTERDMIIITSLLLQAQAFVGAGVTSPIMTIRDTSNTNHLLTPEQMSELAVKGMKWVEETMKVSWAMKDGVAPFEAGIPEDFNDNSYWP